MATIETINLPTTSSLASSDDVLVNASGITGDTARISLTNFLTVLGGTFVPKTTTVNGHALSSNVTVTKGDVGLGNVENTALSTWAGSTNLTTVGTIGTGTWNATAIAYAKLSLTNSIVNADISSSAAIANSKLANSAITIAGSSTSLGGSISLDTITGVSTDGLLKRDGANILVQAVSGVDYAPAPGGSVILASDGSGGFTGVNLESYFSYDGTLSLVESPWDTGIVISAKGTDATSGSNKAYFIIPYDVELTGVFASVDVAPTGSDFVIDINVNGSSILSTKITINAGETYSGDSSPAPVISSASISAGDTVTFDIDQVGSSTPGQMAIVYLVGTRIL